MIKKVLLGLFVSVGLGISFSNGYFIEAGLGYVTNQYDNSYDVSVLKRGKFLTQFLGSTKPIFVFDSNSFFFWNNGQLYLFDYMELSHGCGNRLAQGYVTQYYSCDVFSGSTSSPQNCSLLDNVGSDTIGTFLKGFTDGDWFYYSRKQSTDYYCRAYSFEDMICFSSNQLNRSFCFKADQVAYGSLEGLTGSLGLIDTTTFTNIDLLLLENPPDYQYSPSEIQTGNMVEIPGDLMTNGDVMNYFEHTRGRDWDMCYVGTTDLSNSYNGDYTRLGGYNIFEAYSILYSGTNVSDPSGMVQGTNTMNVGAWINTFYNNYVTYYVKRQDYLNSDGNPLHYSFWGSNGLWSVDRNASYYPFDGRSNVELAMASKYYNRYQNVDQNGQDVAYYCTAVLSTGSDTDLYNGTLPNYLVNNINGQLNNQLNQSTDWQNASYQVPSGSGFMFTGNEDFSTSVKDFYSKLTMLLNTNGQYRTVGIIPDYILGFMILIILFRFLKK